MRKEIEKVEKDIVWSYFEKGVRLNVVLSTSDIAAMADRRKSADLHRGSWRRFINECKTLAAQMILGPSAARKIESRCQTQREFEQKILVEARRVKLLEIVGQSASTPSMNEAARALHCSTGYLRHSGLATVLVTA